MRSLPRGSLPAEEPAAPLDVWAKARPAQRRVRSCSVEMCWVTRFPAATLQAVRSKLRVAPRILPMPSRTPYSPRGKLPLRGIRVHVAGLIPKTRYRRFASEKTCVGCFVWVPAELLGDSHRMAPSDGSRAGPSHSDSFFDPRSALRCS